MLENLYFLIFIAYISMFAHFLKKKVKGETMTAIGHYFKDNFKSTLVAIVSVLIGVMVVHSLGQLNIVSAVGIGYGVDSVFNKWESKSPIPK